MKTSSWKVFKSIFAIISLCFFSFQILAGGLEAGYAFYGHNQESWKQNAFLGAAEYLRETIEKDTMAIGAGMPELYYQLGWDPQIHITDWSDMNDASRAEVDGLLTNQMAFLMTEDTDYENPEFVPYARLSSGDFSGIFYVRKQ